MMKIIKRKIVKEEKRKEMEEKKKEGNGGGDPCYVMEEHDNGLATVLLPWTPASFAGSIRVVPKAQLEYLNCSIDEFSRSISLMGIGIADCLTKSTSTSDQSQK